MDNNRVLLNNKISQFILRIDLTPDTKVDFKRLAEDLKGEYNSYKTELHVNYNINIEKVEINKEDFITYILGNTPSVVLKIDSFNKSIIIESLMYSDSSIYKNRLKKIIEVLKSYPIDVLSKRIGMRFVNTYSCEKINGVSKIFNTVESKAIINAINKQKIARAMIVEEFQNESNLTRVQYGVPNKFYPSAITSYDMVLDIDVYSGGAESIDTWEETIDGYNHQAYDTFISYIKESYLNTLK